MLVDSGADVINFRDFDIGHDNEHGITKRSLLREEKMIICSSRGSKKQSFFTVLSLLKH